MAQSVFSPDAWTRARNRFVEDLTDEEQRVFSQASPEAILYDASAAEKTHQATSTTRGAVRKLQPFVDAVEQYGTALDVYSNVYPLVMGPLWGSIRVVLHLARESGKYFEKIADMFNRISDVLPRLRIYEQLFPNHESLVQSLSVVYFDVLKFCSEAKNMFRRAKRSISTLLWKPFERQFGSHIEAFRRHQEEMEKNVLLSHMIEAADSRALILSDRMKIAKERYDQDRLRVFAALSSAVDYEAKHRKLRGLRHEGTGEWLIQHPTYVAWKESPTSEGLLIHGIPGSGKSVIASLIVDDHLERPESPAINALYFYCDYADPPTLQPVHVYRALLQQLFFRGLMTEPVVRSVVDAHKANIHGLSDQKLTNLLCAGIQVCARLHIVIDGLDECERDVQQAVTNTLYRFLSIGNPLIKIIVTCRDEGHLLTKLSSFDRLQISPEASAADIQSYISHAVQSGLSSGDLTLRSPVLKERIISKLVTKAQGMFLWVHFQLADLCEAASDEGIREVLEHLPEGLYDTYTRIFKKITKTGFQTTVLKVMMWMVCARRPLRVEELQEAVAFDIHDKSWNADKIPNSDKMIKSCHGLVVRDTENGIVRLAHHTVQQYLTSPQENLLATNLERFEEFTPGVHFWPELYEFKSDPKSAEAMAGGLCVTYLSFSDFGTAVARMQNGRKLDLAAAFKDRGPVSIPAALGLGKHFRSIPYKFFGNQHNFKMPDIDFSKYLNIKPQDRRPSPELRERYALLEYVIEYWPSHTLLLQEPSERNYLLPFWDFVQHTTLAFEFRPWGSNDHFGTKGCKGCPVPNSDDLEPKDLPSMPLVHWAAETGYLKLFDIVKPPLQEYLKHERHHDETLLIACRHGQFAVVKLLLARGTFDLTNGRAIVAACASGNQAIVEYLHQDSETSPLSLAYKLGDAGAVALYQAASDGHESMVDFLVAIEVPAYITDSATGLTPLQIAAENGHLQVLKVLFTIPRHTIPPGRSLDAPHEKNGKNALHYAADGGREDIVSFLVNHGSACDELDVLGETALIKASRHGHAMVANVLLEAGADPLTRGGELFVFGSSVAMTMEEGQKLRPRPMAVHHAASNGHDNVLAILPYSDKKCGDLEALHLGAMSGHINVVRTLLSKGANIESKNAVGNTGLHLASMNGHQNVVQLLLDSGCNEKAYGNTGLHYASRNGHPNVVQLLLDSGYDIDGRDREGYTALHHAVRGGHIKIINLLVACGAAIDARTFQGDTPLHIAAQYADGDTIRALVQCGATLEEHGTNGQTALETAVSARKPANMLALIELGAHWIQRAAFERAATCGDCRCLEILLGRLSSATARERQDADAVIQTVRDLSRSFIPEAVKMLKDWQRKEGQVGRGPLEAGT